MDGRWLAMGAVAAIGVAGAVRRGSRGIVPAWFFNFHRLITDNGPPKYRVENVLPGKKDHWLHHGITEITEAHRTSGDLWKVIYYWDVDPDGPAVRRYTVWIGPEDWKLLDRTVEHPQIWAMAMADFKRREVETHPEMVSRQQVPAKPRQSIRHLPRKGSTATRTELERSLRLAPGGVPKWIRAYDNGGKTADRYTVVFTGRYPKEPGWTTYLSSSAHPYHPQGIGMVGEWNAAYSGGKWPDGTWQHTIDRPRYAHLGRKIGFDDLPDEVQAFVLDVYADLWKLPVMRRAGFAGRRPVLYSGRRSIRDLRRK